jgi:hypothetical protein
MRHLFALFALTFACEGCTTLSLKRQSLRLAESSVDLRYRETMENLAIIAANPAMLPAFSTIYSGSTNVADTVPFNANNAWSIGKLAAPTTYAFNMDYPLSRAITQNWSLDPTIAPEKLRAMRCACWWALFGPLCAFGDCSSLERFEKPALPGYYFDVADKLRALPAGWIQRGLFYEVPKCASYQAHCGELYVWVMPSDMEYLSRFVLILQGIARVTDDSVYYPKVNTSKVVLDLMQFDKHDTTLQNAWNANPSLKSTDGQGFYTSKVTLDIDEDGWVTPGQGVPSLPRKTRYDNVGTTSDLKSSIIAAIKGP